MYTQNNDVHTHTANMYTHIHTQTHTDTHRHTHIDTHMHTHTHIHTHIHTSHYRHKLIFGSPNQLFPGMEWEEHFSLPTETVVFV